jgi:tetratricopeptide (TPR) repeat protein
VPAKNPRASPAATCIRVNPNYAEAFNSRGFAYAKRGQFDRAIRDYDQAIRLIPNYAEAFSGRGVAYAREGQHDRAIQDYDQAIRLNPNDAIAFSNRGFAKRAKGDSAGGDADIAKANQLNPNARLPVTAPRADSDPKPTVTEVALLYETGAKLMGVTFKFEVKDVKAVQENKLLAEKLLPDAIAYAEARRIPMIAIQANQITKKFFGLFRTGSVYGYVWKQDPAGGWIEYTKKAP